MTGIKKFDILTGQAVEPIEGQTRLGYALSDTMDFYEMAEFEGRDYQGSIIYFFDYENSKVWVPFQRERNVLYGSPVYYDGFYYFLQGDFNDDEMRLIKFSPEQEPLVIRVWSMEELNLYNLMLIGDGVNLVSEEAGGKFVCYYPQKLALDLADNESVVLLNLNDGMVYISAWIEEGWDDQRDCQGPDYKYYEKTIIRDTQGNTLSEFKGSLNQTREGEWWLS